MKDISVIIAHRGDPLGLWATIHSCEMQLQHSGFSYEYCICVNGESEFKKNEPLVNLDLHRILHFLHKAGVGGKHTILQKSIAPPKARQLAVDNSSGMYLFFLDNHCLVEDGYFNFAVYDMKYEDKKLIHSVTKFFSGEDIAYEYGLTLEKNFWAIAKSKPKSEEYTYPIAAGGHGGFAAEAKTWKEIGGYWDGFVGYGGEELSIDLQYWLRGHPVYLNPNMAHYHWAGKRGYSRHFTADYYRNMMMSANIIGGEKWMQKVYDSFTHYPEPLHHPFFDLMTEAYYASAQYAQHVRSHSSRSLDELLVYFKEKNISH